MKEYNLGIDFEIGSFFCAVFHRDIRSKPEADRGEWILEYVRENNKIKAKST